MQKLLFQCQFQIKWLTLMIDLARECQKSTILLTLFQKNYVLVNQIDMKIFYSILVSSCYVYSLVTSPLQLDIVRHNNSSFFSVHIILYFKLKLSIQKQASIFLATFVNGLVSWHIVCCFYFQVLIIVNLINYILSKLRLLKFSIFSTFNL